MTSYDALAVRALLTNNTRALAALTKDVAYATGTLCPECGSGDHIEDNGHGEYLCLAVIDRRTNELCDYRWGTEHGERYGF